MKQLNKESGPGSLHGPSDGFPASAGRVGGELGLELGPGMHLGGSGDKTVVFMKQLNKESGPG